MKGSPTFKKKVAVLRDVMLHPQGHTLARPAKVQNEKTAGNSQYAASPQQNEKNKLLLTAGSTSHSNVPISDPYEDGYTAGKVAGYALGLLESEKKIQSEMDGKREKIFQDAFKIGQQKGFELGEKGAREVLKEEMLEFEHQSKLAIQRFHKLSEAINEQLKSYIQNAEEDLIELSFAAVCKILGDGMTSKLILKKIISALIQEHFAGKRVSVHLHPDDWTMISTTKVVEDRMDIEVPLEHQVQVLWVPDSKISLGGMMLCSEDQSLDARLDYQIEALKRSLLDARKSRRENQQLACQSTATDNVQEVCQVSSLVSIAI